ncbi:hybrid sensor histidine kinase/response regulator [Methylobacterium aquaticum]|uniref:hybrid sensor histidine kinase/response regulator n=1 Tax=Methylobacterium aquaticum TaxID=270351 RepID=UPI001931F806|nr:PAS domain-containing protein [Methylobacterium aquaticum]QRE75891.1 PAS domain-containing protein [Methylobacterium aquaticum]
MSVLPPALDYRSLFDASPHPCLVLDPQGRVLTANRAYLAGAGPSRGPDDLVGRHLRDAMPDAADRIAPIEASIARAVATGRPDTVEGGAEGPGWSVTHVPVKDAAGAIGAVLHHPEAHPGPTRPVPEATPALHEAHQRREQIFQQMPGFVAVLHGPDHVFEYVNDAYVTIAGPRDFLGRTVREVFPELAEQGFYDLLDTVYRTAQPFAARAMPIRLAGDPAERAIDLLYQPLRDEAGAVTGIFVGGYDVTEQVRSQAALRDSEERYRTLLESIDVGFCILEMRFDGEGRAVDYRIAEANPAFARQTGADVAGRWVSEFAPDLERHWFDTYGGVARTGQPVHFENQADVFGRWFDVRALRVGDPALAKVAVFFSDISERKRMEEALRVLNASLEAQVAQRTAERDQIWQASTDLFCIATPEGHLLSLNPAWTALLGWSEGELVGRSFLDLVHPEDRPLTVAAAEGLARGEAQAHFEIRTRHRDGSHRWLSWNAVPRDGRVYATVRDVTAIKAQAAALAQAEEALRQSQKMEAVGQLTGGVAHDFNNLLTIIRSSVDFLRRPELPEARKRRYLDAVSDTVDRAAKLTGQLLAFARRQALSPAVFDVGEKVRGVADMIDTVTGARVRVAVSLPDEPCFVRADLSQFETALINMAVNARDAMEGEGTLTLSLTGGVPMPPIRGHAGSQNAFAAIALTDTGPGVPPDLLGRIFEPFFTTKEVGRGTGLGLSQVFGFAKQSGGDVDVASRPGEGATFTLYLPEAPEAACADDETAADPSASPIGAGESVLVVEDNIEVGRFCTQILQDLGYRTTWATNAEEALDRLGADGAGFDVVFSDVVMPGMGGLALAHALRLRLPRLPVVLASGYSHVLAQDDAHGFELLHKPYSAEQLGHILRRVTRQGVRRRAG